MSFTQIMLLRVVTFALRIPINSILVKLTSFLLDKRMSTYTQRIGIDAQILQFRSAKRGMGTYCYRLLNEFTPNGEICLVVTASGHLGKTIKIVRFAIEHKMQIKIINPGLISPWEKDSKVLNRVTNVWNQALDGFDFDSILYLAPLAIPHEVLFDIPARDGRKSRFALYYDNFYLLETFFWKNLTFKEEIIRRMSRMAYVEQIFCISDFARNTLPQDLKGNAVTVPRLNPNKNLRLNHYNKKGFLVVARDSSHKNLRLAIEAFGALKSDDRRRNPLLIVGITRKTLRNLEPSPSKRKFIKVKHHLTDRGMKIEIQSCELIVIPSLMEGLGLLALEGLEFGNLVTCSNVIPARDYIVDKSLLFEHNNATSLSSVMRRVIYDTEFASQMRSIIPKKVLDSRNQSAGVFIFERISV